MEEIMKILVAEDNLENAITALVALDELGLDAEVASNANGAIEKVRAYPYFVVLTDMNMPMESGGEIDPDAGESVAEECGKLLTPCFVVTAAGNRVNHGKEENIVDVLFFSVLSGRPFSRERSRKYQLVGSKTDTHVWKQAWKTINNDFAVFLDARRMFLKYQK